MTWDLWLEDLRQDPDQAVDHLLRGAADVSPYERVSAHEFLLAVLRPSNRIVPGPLLGAPSVADSGSDQQRDVVQLLDRGLRTWLVGLREPTRLSARKISAYAEQVCEALQWPLYFELPETRIALQANRPEWVSRLRSLAVSAYRDPEYDYWQVLASHQADDQLQFFWHSFIVEAGRTRSIRYANLGLLALGKV